MARTIPLTSSGIQPVLLRPITRKLQIGDWQEKLNFYEMEAKFYRCLLKIGSINCSEKSKLVIQKLLLEFIHLEEKKIPHLRSAIHALDTAKKMEFQQTAILEKQLHGLEEQLKTLKTQAFPLLSEIQKITIW